MHARRLVELWFLLASLNLHASPDFTVEEPDGANLTSGAVKYFGGMQSRYVDSTSQSQAPDGTFTVTFIDIPKSAFSSYYIQKSANGQFGWAELFAPGLQPDATGVIQFHDPTPQPVAFYRLFIFTDTHRVFTIRSTGTTDLNGIAVTVVGTNAANFELDLTGMDTTLAPGSNTIFRVTYVASDTNARNAELRIISNVPVPFALTLSGGDVPPTVSSPLLSNITITPAGPGTPAGIAGTVSDGPANGSVVLEVSSDLGQLDQWDQIATISLSAGGSATFGIPNPISDPGSIGAPRNFYRLRVQ